VLHNCCSWWATFARVLCLAFDSNTSPDYTRQNNPRGLITFEIVIAYVHYVDSHFVVFSLAGGPPTGTSLLHHTRERIRAVPSQKSRSKTLTGCDCLRVRRYNSDGRDWDGRDDDERTRRQCRDILDRRQPGQRPVVSHAVSRWIIV